jgi:TRAP-type C4-dicarboxylate transport system permease small subunit
MFLSLLKWIDKKFEEAVMAVFLLIMVLASGAQVFMRYVMRSSLSWSEELTRYLFVWTAFMSIGYCYRKGSSLRIDALINILPSKIRKALEIIVSLITLALFILLVTVSKNTMMSRATQMQVSPAMQMPVSWLYASTVVGFTIGIIRVIQHTARQVKELFAQTDEKPGEDEPCQ